MTTMTPCDRPDLERLLYWQGQMLRSRDFRDQVAIGDERRWWHNRAIHAANGVAVGMEVGLSGNTFDGLSVTVGPGVAYDCFGREIVSMCENPVEKPSDLIMSMLNSRKISAGTFRMAAIAVLPVPIGDIPSLPVVQFPNGPDRVKSRYLLGELPLSVSYQGHSPQTLNAGSASICLANADACDDQIVKFQWEPPGHDEVLVAWVQWWLVTMVSGSHNIVPVITRQLSRPFARPHIASGATIPGHTAWNLWCEPGGNSNCLGFQVRIDTKSSGFIDDEVPHYFASLQGSLGDPTKTGYFPVLYPHIDQSAQNGFLFRLFMPKLSAVGVFTPNDGFDNQFPGFAQRQKLYVAWLGIQRGHSPFDDSNPTTAP